MTDLHPNLKHLLSDDDEAFLRDLEAGQGFIQQMMNVFHGPTRALTIIAFIATLIFSGLIIWTGWQALHATSQQALTGWCTGFLASLLAQGLLKQWFHNRMNHFVILKTLKQIELRLIKLEQT